MKSGSTRSETKVARLRCERGLTQAALAEKTGVNIRAIQRYESGERKIEGASLTVALRIADALGVHPRELIWCSCERRFRRRFPGQTFRTSRRLRSEGGHSRIDV